MKQTIPVMVNRAQLATQLGLDQTAVNRAEAAGKLLKPDARDLNGRPMWFASRLVELEQLLTPPEIAA